MSLIPHFHWTPLSNDAFHGAIAFARNWFDEGTAEAWINSQENPSSRMAWDGLLTLRGKISGHPVALMVNDFRVNGGSYGTHVSHRACQFVEHITAEKIPLVFLISSIGFRLMDGRKAFNSAFSLIPALKKFAEAAPLFTVSTGMTLGLGAIFFRMGHYRFGISDQSKVNLTGPEVIRLFFGDADCFHKSSTPEYLQAHSTMVTEVAPSKEAALARIAHILTLKSGSGPSAHFAAPTEGEHPELSTLQQLNGAELKLQEILGGFDGPRVELFGQLNPTVRTYLIRHDGNVFGLLVNPPGHPKNNISSGALRKYQASLDLFAALGIPVVSLLDTSGVDPRASSGKDADVVSELVATAAKIIDYPHPKFGFFMGRCYGGANVLAMPKIFGSLGIFAVEGCKVGIMHTSIIEELLSGSPRLLERWVDSHADETDDLPDLIRNGTVEKVIPAGQIHAQISETLNALKGDPSVKKTS